METNFYHITTPRLCKKVVLLQHHSFTMLAIFDLDGTLLNSLEDLCNSGNYILSKHGYPTHPLEAYKMFVGSGIRKLVERALPENARQEEILEPLFQEFIEYYFVHKMDKTMPYPGITEWLEGLQQRDIKLAVASNKAHAAMAPLMEHYFPTIRFSAILGNKPGQLPKPDPKIIFEILEITHESPNTTIYIGDSSVDMETAANAGLKKIGVLWGFRTKEELVKAGADALLEKPDLTSFLDITAALLR